jgi:hypothetical protein
MIVVEKIENDQCTKVIHIENYTIERTSTDHLMILNNENELTKISYPTIFIEW